MRQAPHGKLTALGLSALGVVFGDIGTSPLDTFKTILGATEKSPDASAVPGVTFYVGHETVVRREDSQGLPGWQERFFALMERNAEHVSDFFNLPNDQVVEIGRQVAI